jgi:mannan polymerase II complex MNN10 subunit
MNDRETSYDLIAISNKIKYTKKHGYDMIWSFDRSEGNYPKDWDRLKEMEKAIRGKLNGENAYEWIWWIDYDLIVTNSSITLESVVEQALAPYSPAERDQIDMIITPDCFPVNSGSLMVRTTPYVLSIIAEWWRQKEIPSEDGNPRSLQDCLRVSVGGWQQ